MERITYLSQHHPDKGLFLANHTHPGVQSPWQPSQGPDCHHVEQSKEKGWAPFIWYTALKIQAFIQISKYIVILGMESSWPRKYDQRIQRASGNLTNFSFKRMLLADAK